MLLILLGIHVPLEVIKWKSFENIFKCVTSLASTNKMYFIQVLFMVFHSILELTFNKQTKTFLNILLK